MGFDIKNCRRRLRMGLTIAPSLQSCCHFITSFLGLLAYHDITVAFIFDYMYVVVLAGWRGSIIS